MHFLRIFLRLFRNYVYDHFILPKINKRGGVGLEDFQKLTGGGGRLFGNREYNAFNASLNKAFSRRARRYLAAYAFFSAHL